MFLSSILCCYSFDEKDKLVLRSPQISELGRAIVTRLLAPLYLLRPDRLKQVRDYGGKHASPLCLLWAVEWASRIFAETHKCRDYLSEGSGGQVGLERHC